MARPFYHPLETITLSPGSPLESPVGYAPILDGLRKLYVEDPRPWLIGFSGGKDSTMVASLVFEILAALPPEQRSKPISVVCTDTRVEIPAISEMIEGTLEKMRAFASAHALPIDVNLLKPPAEQSFWVNMLGRGYPPPNRLFRWCTQRLKIDPVSVFVRQRIGHWGAAVLHLGARRAESSTRAQAMAGRETRNGLRRHEDLPNVWINNPIEFLTTGEVWAYLLQKPNPWGGDNRALYQLYANASGGECPLVVDESTPSCGNSRFGCWTCTVVERDKASEGLLASGDERMEALLEFRETLQFYRDPANRKRDAVTKKGQEAPGPLTMPARKELLAQLIQLEATTKLELLSQEELFLIQRFWKSARDPDDGYGVARIVSEQRGTPMSDPKQEDKLRELEESISAESGISAATLRRMLAKVADYGESHRAFGLPDELLQILQDDLRESDGTPPQN
jgi:DNA sulfur modification protein DndC